MERAEELKAHLLDTDFPIVVKSMARSNVNGGCWLRLPKNFCKSYLPKDNVMVSLIDESQEEYPVKYNVENAALSAGWTGFSVAHKLVEGDALVFQLVKPTVFKVYITSAYSMSETDEISDLNLCTRQKRIESRKRTRRISEITAERVPDNITSVGLQQPRGESISKGEEDRLEFLGGTGFSKSRVNFEDINNLQSFTVVVNGSVIDSQLSEQERSKYYELSHSQKDCLHDNLSGSNCMLAAGLILQTIIIADAIRAAKLSTSEKQFAEWDKDLLSLELLGMKVGFLRARIKILSNLVLKSEEVMDSNMFRKAIAQRDDVKEKVNTLKDKLTELQETRKQLDTEIGSLEMNIDHYEQKFQEVAGAPW